MMLWDIVPCGVLLKLGGAFVGLALLGGAITLAKKIVFGVFFPSGGVASVPSVKGGAVGSFGCGGRSKIGGGGKCKL